VRLAARWSAAAADGASGGERQADHRVAAEAVELPLELDDALA
jgi:hypothetical protein